MAQAKIETLVTLPVDLIDELIGNVNVMADAEYNSLCEDIAAGKPVPPVVVVKNDGGRYTVLDGNHRLRACKAVGRPYVPGLLIDLDEEEQRLAYAAKLNIVRGQIDRTLMTQLWHRIRAHKDQIAAMHTLGISSEDKLSKLVALSKRKVDATVVVSGEIEAMMARVSTVDDLVAVIRAALGDSGTSEFDYLAFQVHGSRILLLRCTQDQMKRLEASVGQIQSRGLNVPEYVVSRLSNTVGEQVELVES